MQTLTPPTIVDAPAPKSHKRRNIVIGSVAGLLVLGGIASATKQPTDTATPAATIPVAVAPVATDTPVATDAAVVVPVAPAVTVAPVTVPVVTVPAVTVPATPAATKSQEQAVKKAESYLSFTSFSQSGLAKQLEFDQFSPDDAAYAAANVGADWMEQAAKKAASYLEFTSFSHSGLVDQLVFDGFTPEQAEYGAASTGL